MSTRIDGLVSGIDTASLIKALLQTEQGRIDKLYDQRDELLFEQEAFRDVNSKLYELQQVALALRLESTFKTKIVTSSDETALRATATAEAARGTHIVKINQVAEAARADSEVVTTYSRTDVAGTAGLAQTGGTATGATEGTHSLTFTSGRGGRIVGRVTDLTGDETMADLGATVLNGLRFSLQGISGRLTSVKSTTTVNELIDLINTGVPLVRAELVSGRVVLTAAQGDCDFGLSDTNYTSGLLAKVLGFDTEVASVAEVVGGVQGLAAGTTLGELGVSTFDQFGVIINGERMALSTGGPFNASTTVSTLMAAIEADAPGVSAELTSDGRLALRSDLVGVGFTLADDNYSDDIAAKVFGLSGRQSTQARGAGSALVTAAASGARVLGGVSGVTAATTLRSLGVSTANGLTITVEGGSSFTVSGLSTSSSLQDLVDTINAGQSNVTAQVVTGRLLLAANDGGRNFTVSDANYTNGVATCVLGITGDQSTADSPSGGAAAPIVSAAAAGKRGKIVGAMGGLTATTSLGALGITTDARTNTLGLWVDDVSYGIAGLTTASTVDDLIGAIEDSGAPVNAYLDDGHLVIEAEDNNGNLTLYDSGYYDDGVAGNVMGFTGIRSSVATITSAATGLTRADTLGAAFGGGITDTEWFTITLADGTSTTLEFASTPPTVGEFIDAVNSQATGVRASLTANGAVELAATSVGMNFSVADADYVGTIAGELFGLTRGQSTILPSSGNALVTSASTGSQIVGNELYVLNATFADGDETAGGAISFSPGDETQYTVSSQQLYKAAAAAGADVDRAIFGDAALADYAIEFQGRVTTTITHAMTAEVRYDSGTGNSYRVDFADSSHALGEGVHIYYNTGGGDTLLGTLTAPSGLDLTVQHTYRVEVEGKNIRAYVDGTLMGVVSDHVTGVGDLAAGQATVRTDDDGEAVFWDNIKLTPLATANGVADLLNTSLTDLGVTTANSLMTNLENVTTEVATPATLQELLDNLEAVDGMKVALVGGRLQVYTEDPRKDFGLGEAGGLTTGTITKVLFGLNSAQFTQSQPSGTAVVTAASTDEYTVADTVIPLHGGSPSFHTTTGAEGTGLDYLFAGGILYGTGINRSFVNGEESLYTSAEISAGVDTAARVDGGYNVGGSATSMVTEPSSTLVARSIFPDARAGRYTVEYNYDGAPSAWHYRILNASGVVQGTGVLGSDSTPSTFVSYVDSDLAGSTFTHTYPSAGPPASGETFEFVLKLDTSASLAEAGFTTPATTATNGVFTINGVEIQISDYTTETVESVLAKINGSGAGVVARYDSREDRFIIASTTIGSSGEVELGSNTDSSDFLEIAQLTTATGATSVAGVDNEDVDLGTAVGSAAANLTTAITSGTFTINGVTLYVDASKDTLQDIIDRINGSGAHVRASYDSSTDRFVLQSSMDDKSATTNTTRIRAGGSGDSSNILQALHIGTASQQQTARYVGEAGKDAKLVFDGTTYTRVSNTVTDLVDGLTLTLLAASDKTLTLNVEVDTDRGMGALADFVAKYNEVVDLLNPDQLTDDQEEYLATLTDDDRADMTYTEIETYTALNEKYRTQELIRTDSALRRVWASLRRAVTSAVGGLSGPISRLMDLGIETYAGPDDVVTDGTLVYDSTDQEEILRKLTEISGLEDLLTTHEDDVLALFASQAYTGSGASVLSTALVDPASGFTVPADGQALSFRVGDGVDMSSSITLQAGRTYTQAQVLELLDRAGLNVGDGDDFGDSVRVTASFDSQGRLLLSCTGSGLGDYQVVLRDDSRGTNTLGTVFGFDISSSGQGLSRLFTDLLSASLESDGVLGYRVKTDGTIERDIDRIEDSITAYEARLDAREQALNRQFTIMETMLSQLQSQGDYVLNALSSANNNSSGNS